MIYRGSKFIEDTKNKFQYNLHTTKNKIMGISSEKLTSQWSMTAIANVIMHMNVI